MKKSSVIIGAGIALVVGLIGGWLSRQPAQVTQVEISMQDGLAGVQVVVDGASKGETDSQGRLSFEVEKKAGAQVAVSLSKEGYPNLDTSFTVTQLDRQSLALSMPSGEINMELRVWVRDEKGAPAVQKKISVDGVPFGYTNASGKWEGSVRGRLGGGIEVEVEDAPGGQRVMLGREPRELSFTVVPAVAAEIDMVLQVRVKDENGEPAAQKKVSVDGVPMGYTDASGKWEGSVRGKPGAKLSVVVEGILDRKTVLVGREPRELSFAIVPPPVGEVKPPPPPPPEKLSFRITIKDDAGRPIPGVTVRRDGENVGISNKDGIVDGRFSKMNVEYRFSFEKEGYVYADGKLPVNPVSDFTEREVILEPLHLMAVFIDSLNKEPAIDIEVFYQGSLLLTTAGVQEKVPIPKVGAHTFELRSADPRYPSSQQRTVAVNRNGEEVTVYVLPKPIEFMLHFTRDGRPVVDKEVNISGTGYRDKGRTDKDGQVRFSSYAIQQGQQYKITLTMGTGEYHYNLEATTYTNVYGLVVSLVSHVRITSTQETASLELYKSRKDFALKKPPLHSGTGSLEIASLDYGEYFLIARGEATIEEKIVISGPEFTRTVDTSDPYVRAEKLWSEGREEDAVELYKEVGKDHPKYSEAQKKVGFYYNRREEFNDAVPYFDNAIEAPHSADPYLYLAAAQANHRAGKYEKGMDYARKAFTYKNLFAKEEREAKRVQAEYTQALCLHDKHFKEPDPDKKCAEAQKVLITWDNFIANAQGQDVRDAPQRKSQVETEIISSDCE